MEQVAQHIFVLRVTIAVIIGIPGNKIKVVLWKMHYCCSSLAQSMGRDGVQHLCAQQGSSAQEDSGRGGLAVPTFPGQMKGRL